MIYFVRILRRSVMSRRVLLQSVLCSVLMLVSEGPPLLAQVPEADKPFPATDLFRKGWKLEQGLGTPINMVEAIQWYQMAAGAGNPLATARLARIYFSGNGVEEDQPAGERLAKGIFSPILTAAEKGDAIAQNTVGTMYADGLGVPRDSAEALKWLQKSADQNLPQAQANLAVLYENGYGVRTSFTEAAKWYQKAAEQGNAMGQAYLGDLYSKGRGVLRDPCEAMRLYTLSAAQNYAHAQTNLGYMYEHGCGVCRDSCAAARLYRLAADQGFAVAQANLGTMYEKGCGVPQDLCEAVNWYRRAAAQGDVHAIKALHCLGYES
jgi:TPR repeat protein